jgi:hypothetical protein
MICKLTNHKSLHNLRHHFQHGCPCQNTRSCENQLKASSAQKLQTRFLQCFGSIHKLSLCHERIILKLMLIIRLVLLLSQHHQWMASIISRKQNFTSPVSISLPNYTMLRFIMINTILFIEFVFVGVNLTATFLCKASTWK